MKTILIIIGILLIANVAVLAFITNFNCGIVLTLALGIVCLLYGIYLDKIRKVTKIGILKGLRIGLYIFVAISVCVIGFIAIFGKINTVTYKEDALIILGAGIRGENITLTLKHRLDAGIEYANINKNAIIVVSGGKGLQEDITEALAMERYLIEKGVPRQRIIKEEQATSTFENFVYSKKILDTKINKPYKIAFVTNGFHIFRATQLAKIAGINATHTNAKLDWYMVAITYLREVTAIAKLCILQR